MVGGGGGGGRGGGEGGGGGGGGVTPTLTDDKDLSRLVPGGLGLGGLHLLEELLEDPEQRLVVLGAEHLGDKRAALGQELAGQFQGHESQVGWKGNVQGGYGMA